MKYTLGIDPGMKGGWAALEDGEFIVGGRMPIKPYGKNYQIDGYEWGEVMHAHGLDRACLDAVAIEHVWGRENDTPKTAFSFGNATGGALMFCQMHFGLAPRLVVPTVWKKHHGLLKKDKDASRARAIELWPDHERLFKVKRNEGITEAALIAKWMDNTVK